MDKKVLILIIIVGSLFILTVIAATILTGKTGVNPLTAPAPVKMPAVEKAQEEASPAKGNAESIPVDTEKEFEPTLKGDLLN
jgi:flagellar basal body-associated protein FliL